MSTSGITRDHAVVHRLPHALGHRGDEFLGDGARDDAVFKHESGALFRGFGLDDHMPVLAPAARLPDEPALSGRGPGDGFPVGHLGLADVRLHLEFAHQTVHDDLEVKFAHALDQSLSGFLVRLDSERGILLHEARHGLHQLVLIGLGLRLDGHGDHRRGECHGFEDDGMLHVAERVSGLGEPESDRGRDVPRRGGLQGPPACSRA